MGAVAPSERFPEGVDSPALRLLGPLAVASSTGLTALRLRPKAAALLARVAADPTPVARRALAGLLFADAEDQRGALRWYINYLRRHLPPEISPHFLVTTDAIGYVGPTDVDVFRAGAAVVVDDPTYAEAVSILELYRGDFCQGLAVVASVGFDTWLFVEQEQLRRWYRRATEAFAGVAIADGRADQASGALARLVAVDPYHEEGHVLLIESLEAAPDPGAAARAYDRYQRIVRSELHAEPRAAIARRYEPDPPSGPTLPIEDLVPLDEITMHVVEWPGAQPTVLGIHGSGGSAYSLTALGERLAPGRRFLAVDLRGHGFSDKPRLGYAIDDHVRDLRQLIEALDLDRPVVLGHSLGGAVATALAAAADVSGLVLLEGVVGSRAFTENAAALVQHWGAQLDAERFGGFDDYLKRWYDESRGGYGREQEGWIDRFARYAVAPLPDGTYRMRALRQALEEEWQSAIATDTLAALARVRCPVVIVQARLPWLGGRPYFTDDVINQQLQAAPHASLVVASNSDHETIIRDPEPAILSAINQLAGAARPST